MNIAPVIERELRAESRRPANFWLRLLAAGVMILVLAATSVSAQTGRAQLGANLFSMLDRWLQFALWIIVPLMTADCVNREKREGTLGLLFLTPLTVLDVIQGKAAIHVLRAVTLLMATLPIFGLPLVLGGVSWQTFTVGLIHQVNACLLGMAAGIYSSTMGGSVIQAMVRAEGYAVVFFIFSLPVMAMAGAAANASPGRFAFLLSAVLAITYIIFSQALKTSVKELRETWQDEAPAPEQPAWTQEFADSEFWQTVFAWNKSRTLDRNPIAWLQEYSWTARLTKWGWLAVALAVEFGLIAFGEYRSTTSWQMGMAVVLSLGIAFSAVWSFRRERETGLLELLLVAPLTVRQLIGGRFWGMVCHYSPAIVVLLFGWRSDRLLNPKAYQSGLMPLILPNLIAFYSTMVVGLFFSMTRLNLLLAWLMTWVLGFLSALLLTAGLVRFAGLLPPAVMGVSAAIQIGLGGLMWFLLHRKLSRRSFVVRKSEGT